VFCKIDYCSYRFPSLNSSCILPLSHIYFFLYLKSCIFFISKFDANLYLYFRKFHTKKSFLGFYFTYFSFFFNFLLSALSYSANYLFPSLEPILLTFLLLTFLLLTFLRLTFLLLTFILLTFLLLTFFSSPFILFFSFYPNPFLYPELTTERSILFLFVYKCLKLQICLFYTFSFKNNVYSNKK